MSEGDLVSALFLACYVAGGFWLYRRRWPLGLFPGGLDTGLERLRRVGRRRIAPVPDERR